MRAGYDMGKIQKRVQKCVRELEDGSICMPKKEMKYLADLYSLES